jgi:translation initiation factor 4A
MSSNTSSNDNQSEIRQESRGELFRPVKRREQPGSGYGSKRGSRYQSSGSGYKPRTGGQYQSGSYSDTQQTNPKPEEEQPEPVMPPKPTPKELSDEDRQLIKEPVESFEELGIHENIIRGIYSYGFEKPSTIQARAIRPVLSGHDVIAQAQSGMGKTGAFTIGTLGRIDENLNAIQALVVVHTMELALQIDTVFRQIAKYTGIRFSLCIKGIPPQENIEKLSGVRGGKPHVVIGTPGRVLDMLHRRDRETNKYIIDQNTIRLIVLDEADEILGTSQEMYSRKKREPEPGQDGQSPENIGFLEQMFKIFKCMPPDIQVCLFSATMGKEFFDITKDFMRMPLEVLVKTEELTLDGISQYLINVEEQKYKFDTLCELYSLLTINQSIIYCNSLRSVEYLTRMLRDNNFTVSYIHGQMPANERELTMADFRSGKSRVLVSTDLLSRGIDIQQVSVVINYDIPIKVESYLHRIGRSGRYGRKGVAINFMTKDDERRLRQIEQYYSTIVEPLPADISRLLSAN